MKTVYNSSCGILAIVRPCGVIAAVTEMYSQESCTQVMSFLVRYLDMPNSIKCIGYDRACEFEPFLKRLSNSVKPNLAAQFLLDSLDFLVDRD